MRISDWSSDVCSSDLEASGANRRHGAAPNAIEQWRAAPPGAVSRTQPCASDAFPARNRTVVPEVIRRRQHSSKEGETGKGKLGVTGGRRHGRRWRFKNGRAPVRTPDTNAQIVCSHQLEKT